MEGGTNSVVDSTMLLRRAKSQVGSSSTSQEKAKKGRIKLFGRHLSLRNFDWSSLPALNSESDFVVVSSTNRNNESNSVTELGNRSSSEVQLDLAKKGGFWKWKRRRSKKKIEIDDSNQEGTEKMISNTWEVKELVSKDRKTKLKADVFFATYDQRDVKAAGESACAAIVAVMAHWLHLNPGRMPNIPELDNLITEGSSEWRKLCQGVTHNHDRHFDFETILGAQLRPLAVHPSNSRYGFFHPERFEHLKDAQSFDDIWEEINEATPSVYIVRWNDHFFILKLDSGANYIIDSLGERLHEGCTRAYILRFDDSTVLYEEGEGDGEGRSVICQGKGCCKEYMKRFLAALTLREFKEEEEKGRTLEVGILYRRLQIDFHLSTPSSANSTANTSISVSPHTSPDLPSK